MKLADYLSERQMTQAAFAARIGVSAAFISQLCNGKAWLGHDVAEAIERETDGAVTSNDFMRRATGEAT